MIIDGALILLAALAIDLVFGEPPQRVHLTVWMGRFIERLEPPMRRLFKNEKVGGSALALVSIAAFTIPSALVLYLLPSYSWGIYIVASTFLLKTTFAFKSMFGHVMPIYNNLERNLDEARRYASRVVRRDTSKLDKPLVASVAIETVAEGFVDGTLSPLFYYCLFGVPGAVAYRVINTLDSTVGYLDARYARFGWFSAKLDTIANYLPARIAAVLFTCAALFLELDWRGALRIAKRDHALTKSRNAGWPMSAMAGALNGRLEKAGSYALGDPVSSLDSRKIMESLRIFALSTSLFSILVMVFTYLWGVMFGTGTT